MPSVRIVWSPSRFSDSDCDTCWLSPMFSAPTFPLTFPEIPAEPAVTSPLATPRPSLPVI